MNHKENVRQIKIRNIRQSSWLIFLELYTFSHKKTETLPQTTADSGEKVTCRNAESQTRSWSNETGHSKSGRIQVTHFSEDLKQLQSKLSAEQTVFTLVK